MAGTAICPGDDDLAGFLARSVEPAACQAIESHLDSCARCREAIGHLAATGEVLGFAGRWSSGLGVGRRRGVGVAQHAGQRQIELAVEHR